MCWCGLAAGCVSQILRLKSKVRSFAFCSLGASKSADAVVALSMHNNTIEVLT